MGLYPDGRPGELFITMAKEGSTIGGLMDCFGTAVSMSLQYGVPLEVYVNKFSHTRFEPMGLTKNPDIRIAKSIVDYIFRWLGITFLPGYREANRNAPPATTTEAPPAGGDPETELQPVAMKAGGPAAGQGAAKTNGAAANGSSNGTGTNGSGANGSAAKGPGNGSAAHGSPAHTGPTIALKLGGIAAVVAAPQRLAARRAGRGAFRSGRPQRAVRQFPDRRPQLRPLRRNHGPLGQLLPLLQLRQQHGLFVSREEEGLGIRDYSSSKFGPLTDRLT